jgi:hypothetical protein
LHGNPEPTIGDMRGEEFYGYLVLTVLAAIVFAVLYFFWPLIEHLLNAVTILMVGGLVLLLSGAFLYQSYDAFRSGITGTQAKESALVDDPSKGSNRMAALVWGVIALFFRFGILWWFQDMLHRTNF